MVKRTEYNSGTIMYRNENNGLIVYKNENGEVHREDGPALIYPDGTEIWCKNGEVHREDGPAAIYPSGRKDWYLYGVYYTFKGWCDLVNISGEEKMELVLKYG